MPGEWCGGGGGVEGLGRVVMGTVGVDKVIKCHKVIKCIHDVIISSNVRFCPTGVLIIVPV